ncbi:MAG: hypothetical protein DIU74_006990 [Pseudomonadota bacterium]
MDAEQLEKIRLMARLKLQVKRVMKKSVDLQALATNPDYAERVLADIEEHCVDEDMLVTVLTLREMLVPKRPPRSARVLIPGAGATTADEDDPRQHKLIRDYRYGARGGGAP